MSGMGTELRFKLVFDKLEAMQVSEDKDQPWLAAETRDLAQELDELAELRRLSTDISDPEPSSYTST